MTRRNQLLALVLLLAFIGFGVIYFRYWVVQKPFGIVLIIGEGLAPARVAPTRVFAGSAATPLALDAMPHTALLVNDSADFATPDAAAAATAIATGTKVNNRRLALGADGQPLVNLIELARQSGRATGLVTDGSLTNVTAAAFYAHTSDGNDRDELARTLVDQAHFDVVLGGGSANFLPQDKGGERVDRRDLLLELRRRGVDVVRTRAELDAVPMWRRPRLFGAFARNELAFPDEIELRETQPALGDMVRRAIELLQYNRDGYLLVVNAALMRRAAEENNGERTLGETAELDRAVNVAQHYIGSRSTIVVCGDLAIGGLTMNGAPSRHDEGIAVLGLNAAGSPWLTWASGPNGTTSYGTARPGESPTPRNSEEEIAPHPPEEPAAFYAPTAAATVSDTIAFGSGMGTEALHGTLPNTAIFRIIAGQL